MATAGNATPAYWLQKASELSRSYVFCLGGPSPSEAPPSYTGTVTRFNLTTHIHTHVHTRRHACVCECLGVDLT